MQHDTIGITRLQLGKDVFVPVAAPKQDGSPRWWLPDKPQGTIPCLHTLSDNSPWPIKYHMKKLYSDLNFKSVYETTTGTTLKEMTIEGFGMAWLPLKLIAEDLEAGRLVRVAEPENDILVDIVIYRNQQNSGAKVLDFWDVLQEHKNA